MHLFMSRCTKEAERADSLLKMDSGVTLWSGIIINNTDLYTM